MKWLDELSFALKDNYKVYLGICSADVPFDERIKLLIEWLKKSKYEINGLMRYVTGNSHDASYEYEYSVIGNNKWTEYLSTKEEEISSIYARNINTYFSSFEDIDIDEWSKFQTREDGEGRYRVFYVTESDKPFIIRTWTYFNEDNCYVFVVAEFAERLCDSFPY